MTTNPHRPPAALPVTVAVAFEGFSDFERTALASFFRLAEQRAPAGAHAYSPVGDATRADWLIVDADDADAIDVTRRAGRLHDTVFVGTQAPAGALAWLPRPIDPLHIVRVLDGLVQQRRSGPLGAAAVADAAVKANLSANLPAGVDLLLQDIGETLGATAPFALGVPSAGGGGRAVLVVDDSAIARRFLAQRLERLGYRVHLADSGERALALVERQTFALAFVDITLTPQHLNGIDGLEVCQAIKEACEPDGAGTAVVLVTGQSSATARVQGALAGCDAFLTKPLMAPEFIAALHHVDPLFQWEPMTTAGA